MCDRSSDPTEHDAARERPSALDVEAVERALNELDPSRGYARPAADKFAAEYARLTEPDAGEPPSPDYVFEGEDDFLPEELRGAASTPDTTEATTLPPRCRAIWNGCRCGRAPHADDRHVWMNTLDHDRAVDPARYPSPDTTEATLRDALHPCPCGRRTVEIAPGIGICERDHVWDGYVGLTKRTEVALAVALRAALQQPAVQPEYRCGVCGSGDRVEHNDEMHAQEARAVQPEGGPE